MIFEKDMLLHDLLVAAGGNSAPTDCSYVNVIKVKNRQHEYLIISN